MPTAARSRVGTSEIAAAGKPASHETLDHRGVDRAEPSGDFGTAAQDRGIAGLEAQRAGIRRHIGAALIDHADDAERHAHALDAHAIGPPPRRQDGADRIFELADDIEAVRHGLDPRRIEGQTVEEGCRRAGGFGLGQVLPIGRKDCGLRAADRLGHGGERPVLLGGRRQRERTRGLARLAADVAHRGFELGPCLGRRSP